MPEDFSLWVCDSLSLSLSLSPVSLGLQTIRNTAGHLHKLKADVKFLKQMTDLRTVNGTVCNWLSRSLLKTKVDKTRDEGQLRQLHIHPQGLFLSVD